MNELAYQITNTISLSISLKIYMGAYQILLPITVLFTTHILKSTWFLQVQINEAPRNSRKDNDTSRLPSESTKCKVANWEFQANFKPT